MPTRAVLVLGLLLGVAVTPGWAQLSKKNAARENPRQALRSFLKAAEAGLDGDAEALANAIEGLDLSQVPQPLQKAQGPAAVTQLYTLLTHEVVKLPAFSEIPDAPKGPDVVLYESPKGRGAVTLARIRGEWRFDAATVGALADMLDEVSARQQIRETKAKIQQEREQSVADWVREKVPTTLRGRAFLLEYWQWGGLLALLLIGLVLNKFLVAILLAVVLRALRRQGIEVDREVTRKSLMPLGFLVMSGIWWLGLGWFGLPKQVLTVMTTAVEVVAACAGVWAAYRAVDVVCSALEKRSLRTASKFDDLLVPLVRKSGKVAVFGFGVVFIADTLDFSISSLLAGLGLGGLAFALAAQDTVKNFFGSLTVVLDRPFEVGDWVVIDGVEGGVAEVGFRSTRIRTFYNSIITIPNAKLLTATVDNMGARKYRRWTTKLTLAYNTSAERLEAFCEGVRELIRQHPKTRKDYFQVYVNGLGASAIEILLYVFHQTADWTEELQERHRLILDILRLAEKLQVEIAFPTQTLHMIKEAEAKLSPPPIPTLAHDAGREAARAIVKVTRDGPAPDGQG